MAGVKASTTSTSTTSSTNPAAERIRENQRRSRARRKEFVEGMQRRLDEYEKQGVEATLEMQQAARTVAIENARLRMLLARRGVAADEVDTFLALFDKAAAASARDDDDELALVMTTMTQQQQQHQQQHLQQQHQHQQHQQQHYTISPGPKPTLDTCSYHHQPPPYQYSYSHDAGIDRLAVLAEASIGDSRCGSSGPSVTTPSESTVAAQSPPLSAEPSTMPGTPVSLSHAHPLQPQSQPQPQPQHYTTTTTTTTPQQAPGSASPLVMSCNTAAQIIAEMQGGAPLHKHSVRAGLACQDDECECFVKNTLLFQIMERNGTSS